MGLTIHYDLKTDLTDPKDVRQLVETVRQFALDLPFQEVGEIKEFTGQDTDWKDKSDPDHWVKLRAAGHLVKGVDYLSFPAQHIIVFSTHPGDGCDEAIFGFCRYPPYYTPPGKKRLATKLDGWRWSSFCKTQYASDPKCGGVENFLRCHLCVIKVLDFLNQTGLATVEVGDEGGYWEQRDLKKLGKDVGDWNILVAGAISAFRSTLEGEEGSFQAPITGFPNFEHLEAKGLERIADLRRKLDQSEE